MTWQKCIFIKAGEDFYFVLIRIYYYKRLSENRVEVTNCNFVLKYAKFADFYKNL